MRTPDALPPADALPPEWGLDGELLRQALSEGGTALPAVSDDLPADLARLDVLLRGGEAGGDAAGLREPSCGDLDLLADLLVAQSQVAAGIARAPSPAVLEAVCAAFDAAPVNGVARVEVVGPALDASQRLEGVASVSGVGRRVLGVPRGDRLPAPAARALRPGRWLAAAAAVLVACLGTWLLQRSGRLSGDSGRAHDQGEPGSSKGLNAAELASLNQTLGAADESTAGSAGTRAQVAPFVEARLWRRVAGRALRGGENLGLAQGPQAAGEVPADVVLSWLPDAASGTAARLRVHVSGPEGLVVLLPDLGVEAVLAGSATAPPADGAGVAAPGEPPATYVDLELPGGWTDQLAERELRLAFRWPAPAAKSSAVNRLASAEARFTGVSLASSQAVKGS